MEQDKRLITLIQGACKVDATARALSLVNQLHHLASFDTAIKVADFYHLVGLQEKIRSIQSARISQDRLEDARERRREWEEEQATPPRRKHAGSANHRHHDLLAGDAPPVAMHRPGLALANPVIETSRFSQNTAPTRTSQLSTFTDLNKLPSPEKQRKRTLDDVEDHNELDSITADDTSIRYTGPSKSSKFLGQHS